jgi:hypothetical protein
LDRTVLDAVLVSWPTQAAGFLLQSGTHPYLGMSNVTTVPVVVGADNVVLHPMNQPQEFFRLLYNP